MADPNTDQSVGSKNNVDKHVAEALDESPLGQHFIGLAGVIAITVYLVALSLFDFYMVVKVWPPPGTSPAAVQTPVAQTQAPPGSTPDSTPEVWKVKFAWCVTDDAKSGCRISVNTALFLIAILCGALGGLLHAFRSLYWYIGHRKLRWSWTMMYLLMPFTGALLALIFYLVVRAGFMPTSGAGGGSNTAYGFAAMGALVGLFSEEATLKLKQVAETIFSRSAPSAGAALTVTPTTLAAGKVGQKYTQTLAASGGTPPYKWASTSGQLPAGLSLDSGGTISGTPSTAGDTTFTVRVTDAASNTKSQPFSISITQ